MGERSAIEWTRGDDGMPGSSWNPVTGCQHASEGCNSCYAASIARRFAGTKAWPNGFAVTLRPERLEKPLRWRRPRRIFVCSTSDLFHNQVPETYIAQIFAVMALSPRHRFIVLTKRHARMRALLTSRDVTGCGHSFEAMVRNAAHNMRNNARGTSWPRADALMWPLPNVLLGVSAENQRWFDIRVAALRDTPASCRIVSLEPLLGPIQGGDLLRSLDWAIVGGESGVKARPMHPDWARSLRDECNQADVAFFFKQWGAYRIADPELDTSDQVESVPFHPDISMEPGTDIGPWAQMRRVGKTAAGRELDGRIWGEHPTANRLDMVGSR